MPNGHPVGVLEHCRPKRRLGPTGDGFEGPDGVTLYHDWVVGVDSRGNGVLWPLELTKVVT